MAINTADRCRLKNLCAIYMKASKLLFIDPGLSCNYFLLSRTTAINSFLYAQSELN